MDARGDTPIPSIGFLIRVDPRQSAAFFCPPTEPLPKQIVSGSLTGFSRRTRHRPLYLFAAGNFVYNFTSTKLKL